ncbi:hypothetical protein GQR58_015938 [Nymphon striatum]|nr:hypothetical protein GQR58_015938 [Nymphon striatum]
MGYLETPDEVNATIKATWASITPQQRRKLIDSMLCHIDAVIRITFHKNKHLKVYLNDPHNCLWYYLQPQTSTTRISFLNFVLGTLKFRPKFGRVIKSNLSNSLWMSSMYNFIPLIM